MDEHNEQTRTQSYVKTTPDDWSDSRSSHDEPFDAKAAWRGSSDSRVYDFAQREAQENANPKGCAGHLVSIVIGIFLVLIGIPMLICPGPGLLVITLGAGMILAGLGLKRKQM